MEASLRSRFRCRCAISIQIYPERSFQVHRADKSRLLVKTRLFILQIEWPFFSPSTVESVSQKQRSVSCFKKESSRASESSSLRQAAVSWDCEIRSCARTHAAIRYLFGAAAPRAEYWWYLVSDCAYYFANTHFLSDDPFCKRQS